MAGTPLAYRDFSAGLQSRPSPYLLDQGLGPLPARDLQNVQGVLSGAITKRNGLVTLATPATALTSLFASEATPVSVLVGATGTTLVTVTGAGAVATIKSGVTNNARWEFISGPVVAGQGPIYAMNGVDTPQQWSGATAGTATANWVNASGAIAVPNGKYMTQALNQVYVAGVAGTPSRVYISAINDPTNWDPASNLGAVFIDLDPNDGQVITAIGRVGPYVLVSKPRKLFVIADAATATVRRLSDSVGCVAHRSIASGPNGTYFLDEDRGIYLTNGSSIQPVSDIIQPNIDAVGVERRNAAGYCLNGHYYLSVAGAGVAPNDTVLDYDETLKSWWRHTFGSNQFASWHPAGGVGLYSAKASSPIVDQCFVPGVNVDNGTPFKWRWAGPWQSPSFYRRRLFPTPQYRKRFRQIRFDGFGSVDFSLAMDFATTESLMLASLFAFPTTTWGGTGTWGVDGIWGDAPPIARQKFFPSKVANAYSMVFSATSNTADGILSFTLYLVERSDSQS